MFRLVPQQTIRDLFDMNDGEKREVALELSVPQTEEEESVNKQSTTILEQVGHKITINLVLCSYNNYQKKSVVASFWIDSCRLFVVLRMRRTLWRPHRPKQSKWRN